MHIRETIYIEAPTRAAMDAARKWMQDELQPLDTLPHMSMGEITEGTTSDGEPSISTEIDQDGIRIVNTVVGSQHESGTKLTMDLQTGGDSFGAKLRNLSFFPGRKLLRNQVKASLLQIREAAEK